MKKIRINELARELEVKPGVILDLLPELGVQEKKTHSSSIDEDVALTLRDRLVSSGITHNGSANRDDDYDDSASEDTHSEDKYVAAEEPSSATEVRPAELTESHRPAAAVV